MTLHQDLGDMASLLKHTDDPIDREQLRSLLRRAQSALETTGLLRNPHQLDFGMHDTEGGVEGEGRHSSLVVVYEDLPYEYIYDVLIWLMGHELD